MTDITNKLHITEKSKENLGNDFNDNEDLVKALQHLPENPEEINRQAEEIEAEKMKAEAKIKAEKKIKEDESAKAREAIQEPIRILEQKRKTEAIDELKKLGLNTPENIAKINAIQFLHDSILIGNTSWAYENMK